MSGLAFTFFALRTPLLPFDAFTSWSEGLAGPKAGDDDQSLSLALEDDRARLRARLRKVFSTSEAREALLVASPLLADAFEFWTANPESNRGQGVERALVRYLARMAARPTPFGLFAGTSVGLGGEKTRLEIEGRDSYRRSSRLDLGFLFALTQRLLTDPEVQGAISYRPNGTLYPVGQRLRYVEPVKRGKRLRHQLVAIRRFPELDSMLALARDGASVGQLTRTLARNGFLTARAEGYVRDLIESSVIVPELEIAVTGREPLEELVVELQRVGPTRVAGARLDEARVALEAIDETGVGADASAYSAVTEVLGPLVETDDAPLFQVDLFKPAAKIVLGTDVGDELLRGAEALRRLNSRRRTELERFREIFLERYELRSVPLLEALDSDAGLGFPVVRDDGAANAPLLANIPFPGPDDFVPWGPRENLLFGKLLDAADRGAHEIVFEAAEIESLPDDGPPLPDSVAVHGALAASSQAALDDGDFKVFVEAAYGPSGVRLLGRFCHGDPQLRKFVQEHVRAEEALDPEAIFAEIVHLPEGRVGNVLCRPVLRDYEITYLGRSGAPPERQIPLDDLLVSVRGDRVLLHSQRLARRVVPRLTNAHNFVSFGTPVYRFLTFLQQQEHQGATWSWRPFEKAPFLPRVCLGRLVLSLARWELSREELARLHGARGSELYRHVQSFRSERRLPRLVSLSDGDQLLPIDLDNVLSIESFVHLVKNREEATLVELFPAANELCAVGPEGRFVHELIVPFVREPDAARATAIHTLETHSTAGARRRFRPGSEWLMATLYLGPAEADEVLLETLAPLVRQLVGSGAADRWFFVRLSDPDWHIRIRLHGVPERLRAEVQPALERAGERAWRLGFDTYEREVERYGGPEAVELAEQLFHADSDAVVDVLQGDARADDSRWRLGLVGMDALLSDLGLELEAKEAFAKVQRDRYVREVRVDSRTTEAIGKRFRTERDGLELLLAGSPPEGFSLRSARLRPLLEGLHALQCAGQLGAPIEELAASFVHMHLNRMLRAEHRRQELVLYDFLARLYRSQIERAKAEPFS